MPENRCDVPENRCDVLEIEIFSDVVCPWCFIGKRRLDEALASELGQDTELFSKMKQVAVDVGTTKFSYFEIAKNAIED